MKNFKKSLSILSIALLAIISLSCKDSDKKDQTENESSHTEMMSNEHDTSMDDMHGTTETSQVHQDASHTTVLIQDYMEIKNALVVDNVTGAADAAKKMLTSLNNFDVEMYTDEQKTDLNKIITNAKEQAEHISENTIKEQRKGFKQLSKDVIDLVAITGAPETLYQQFCPMYDRGSDWLSTSKDIQNPYYGSKMLTCGNVVKTIE